MNEWIRLFISMLVFCIGLYWLYCRGIAGSKCISAILFVFRPGKNQDMVTMDACTGWIRHIRRFRESRTYEFAFDAQLSEGNVEVVLLDKRKQPILKLNQQCPRQRLDLDGRSRYFLRWEFNGAAGKCELHW